MAQDKAQAQGKRLTVASLAQRVDAQDTKLDAILAALGGSQTAPTDDAPARVRVGKGTKASARVDHRAAIIAAALAPGKNRPSPFGDGVYVLDMDERRATVHEAQETETGGIRHRFATVVMNGRGEWERKGASRAVYDSDLAALERSSGK